ncbi:MAG: hypothetical protein AABY10_04640 [Nanoarchaeota archaeon]
MATIDPKMVIGAGLALPLLYVWQKWEFSVIFLAALGVYAWVTLDNQFIHKSEQKRFDTPQLGPQAPFLPPEKDWVIDPNTGEPVARYQPPPQYPQQRYQPR